MSQLKKYKRLKYLGKGSYGAAILVELRSNPSQRFVIKEIVIGHLKPAEQAAAKSEADVLHQMNHSNITMYIESFVENAKLYIVMENADGGDLATAIQNRRKDMKYWDEEEVMRIFVQICLALKHVHNANILHRDLKSQNIFLTSKGVVKLGDFGIAKVLDATDDQARTQIGTPYYLSPEICESKPYGRESDVWSLGVLLYELIALEMPFQATSLPALVHRICVAEPNYSMVEKRYSAGLIALTKSMLMKDPQKRPSVNQIVKSDFIKTHISRLLSYTLKAGNGGINGGNVPVALPPSVRPSNVHQLDPDEAEKCIESVHSQIRDQESKDVRNQSNREAQRIAEREKLRKFRNDMAKVRKDSEPDIRAPEESKDEDGRAVYRPAPRVAPAPAAGQRNLSPKSNRNLSPKGGRPLSPKYDRPLSPKLPRPLSPKAPRNMSPKGPRNVSPINARAGAPSSGVGGAGDRGRALTPRGQAAAQAQKEKERKLAAAAAMKQESAYERNQPQQQQQMAVARANNGGGNEYESAARREFFANRAAAQAVKAKVEAYERNGGERVNMPLIGGGGYTSASNAVAAPSNGGVRSHPNSRRGSEVDRDYNYAAEEASVYEQPSSYRGGRRSHADADNEMSEAERRIAQIKLQRDRDRERENAEKEMQLKEALEANRDARRQAQGMKSAIAFDIDLGGNGPSGAAPAKVRSSAVRQSLDDKSVASPAHVHNSPHGAAAASPLVAPSRNVRGGRDDKETTPPPAESDSGKGRTKKSWGPPVAAGDIAKGVVRYSEFSTPVSQMFAPPDREGNSSRLSNAGPDKYFDEDASANGEEARGAHRRDFSRESLDVLPIAGEEDQVVLRRLESKRNSQLEARQQAKEVFKKLREKRRKESELKGAKRPPYADAKVVEHQVVSPVKRVVPGEVMSRAANASPMQMRLMEVMSQLEMANESVQKAVAAGAGAGDNDSSALRLRDPARSRSNSECRTDQPSSSQSNTPARKYSTGADNTPSRKGANGATTYSEDAKEVQALDRHISQIDESDDDLEYTLDNWLTQQKRGVTQRKKNGVAQAAVNLDDDLAIEDSMEGYSTVQKYDRMYESQAKEFGDEVLDEGNDFYMSETFLENSKEDEGRDVRGGQGVAQADGDVVRGKYMGNDVEVVGLQCMLAQALMGDGEEED